MTRKIVAFAGRAGCVDSETEYLSENGWKRISEYSGEKIAVYSSDGVIHWEVPENFICEPATDWYTLKTKYGLDMKLSGEHNVYYITSKGNLYHNTQVIFAYNTNHIEGSKLTEDQTRYIYETNTILFERETVASVDAYYI